MKADLHYHGLIAFQPYWRKVQGYAGKNLMKEITDACFSRGIELAMIVSEADEIPRGSFNDRLGWLGKQISILPQDYHAEMMGHNLLVVEKQGKKVYLVNGQTVRMIEKERACETLVLGNNNIPNKRSLKETLERTRDYGLISVAEHPLCAAPEGIGRELLEKYMNDFDAIEGHNSEMIFPEWMRILPAFKGFTRLVNLEAQKIADKYGKPWIATSDGHWVDSAGTSYIEFSDSLLKTDDYSSVIESLRDVIRNKEYRNVCNYESLARWISWVGKFLIGSKLRREKV